MSAPSPRNRSLALSLAAIGAGMLMLTYAAVPLYQLFCAITGFGGTPQKASASAHPVAARKMTVRFNADTDTKLPWVFKPDQTSVTTRVGEQTLVSFSAQNRTDRAMTGNAVYNVTPHKAGIYFMKVECFCFTEQTLEPRQQVHMPVSFYIDPAILNDRDLDDVDTITLSYTFFQVKR